MKHTSLRTKSYWLLSVSCLALPTLTALGAKDTVDARYTFHELNILGTSLDLVVTSQKQADAEAAWTAALGEVERLRTILSSYDPAAELARVNAARTPVKVSGELIDVLHAYDLWRGKTHGAYSAGVGELVQLWKRAEKEGREPDAASLAAAAKAAGAELYRLDAAGSTVQRLSDTPINVDSLGKGFITQRAAEAAAKTPGVEGLLLNIGGDVTALGSSVSEKKLKWSVTIADPRKPEVNAAPLTEVRIQNAAVATSGSYERGYTLNGKRLSHLIDARTGLPIDPTARKHKEVIAATVIAPDNTTANALATALCLLTRDEGLALIKETPNTGCLLVLADGTTVKSDLFKRAEFQKVVTSTEMSPIAAGSGNRWPAGHEVKLSIDIKNASSRDQERPYVAIWVEDLEGKHVKTLAMWGNEERWLPEMTGWWKFAKRHSTIAQVSRATRAVGRYAFTWDGKDQAGKAVPEGSYKLFVETAFEHGGHVMRSATLECQGSDSAATIDASSHCEAITLHYGKPKD